MKLILLLVAIYSLIFYQQYKIEKSNGAGPGSKGLFKTEGPYQERGFRNQEDYGNADLLIRSFNPGYRFSASRETQMAGLAIPE